MTTSSQKTVFSDIFILPIFFAKILKLIDIIHFVPNKQRSIYFARMYNLVYLILQTFEKYCITNEYRCYVKYSIHKPYYWGI